MRHLMNTQQHTVPMLFNGEEIPQNCPLPWGMRTLSNTWLLLPTAPHMPNAILIEPAVFLQLTLHCPYTLLWDCPFSTPKLSLPVGDPDHHLIHCDLATPPHMPNDISIGPAVFAGYMTDQQTDRQTTETSAMHTMRPKNCCVISYSVQNTTQIRNCKLAEMTRLGVGLVVNARMSPLPGGR